jgi:hypothetical protein
MQYLSAMTLKQWVLVLLGVTVLGFLGFRVLRSLHVDSCLDRGGAWNATTQECNGAPQHVLSTTA